MERLFKEKDNYYHCEGENCNFKSHKNRVLVFFKGKHLCRNCRNKLSISVNFVPLSNPKESTLKKFAHLPREGPRESYKGYTKVTNELRAWAERQESKAKVKTGSVSLTPTELKVLWKHFSEQKLSDEDIHKNIEIIKMNIRLAHEEYKKGLINSKPTFQEEFSKLVNDKAIRQHN